MNATEILTELVRLWDENPGHLVTHYANGPAPKLMKAARELVRFDEPAPASPAKESPLHPLDSVTARELVAWLDKRTIHISKGGYRWRGEWELLVPASGGHYREEHVRTIERGDDLADVIGRAWAHENPPAKEATREETPSIAGAIATIESSRKTHVDWCAWFEANPDEEAKHAETVHSASEQREIIAAYDNVLACLKASDAAERRAADAKAAHRKTRWLLHEAAAQLTAAESERDALRAEVVSMRDRLKIKLTDCQKAGGDYMAGFRDALCFVLQEHQALAPASETTTKESCPDTSR